MAFQALYEYQAEDVVKSLSQKAILNGSDMGTGKTHTAIATAIEWREQVRKEKGLLLPILVVCPINTFESWAQKLDEQAPQLKYTIIDRQHRSWFLTDIYNLKYDVYIMHWAAVRLIQKQIKKDSIIFSVIIGDEIHNIANRDSAVTENFKLIPCFRKYAASGTASGSVPWNLWSILNWLKPESFSDYWAFVGRYGINENEAEGSGSYKKFVKPKNTAILHHIMEPWYIKHLKKTQCCEHHPDGVMPYLPDKNYEKLYVDLNADQRRIYDEMFDKMVAWVGEQQDTPMIAQIAATKIMRLMQITTATPVVTVETITKIDKETGERYEEDKEVVNLILPSSKMDAAYEVISGTDESIVVFTSFKKAAYLFHQYLVDRGISSKVLSGDTPKDDREVLQKQFRDRQFQVIIAVIQAAAEGIDGLQDVCSTAIFLNRSFSAYKNIQAEDRLHRGGQHNNVTIVDIIARDTIDGERLEKLDGSWAAIKAILGIG